MTTLSGLLSAELAATCNALGYFDGEKYHLEPHCKETIKDLIRYLRRDEASYDIRRYLGNAKLLQTDLLPIAQCHHNDKELFDLVLRLVVNLTNPALLLYNEVVPDDKNEHNIYLEIVSHLQNYKEAFCNQKLWVPITQRLGSLLNKNFLDRDEDDNRTIERILILVRNVLHVPTNAVNEWRPDNDASVHDQVIWAFHQSGLLDLLLYIASSTNESNFSLHLLEIICLLVREQPPSLLAKTASQRSVEEKNRDDEELLKIRQSESLAKQQKVKKFLGTRHSNFGGTYVMKNMKSTSERELIYHKPIRDESDITLLDKDKKKTKVPKNRQALKYSLVERRSALSIRLILKQLCVEILNAAYNPLMKFVKELLVRGKSQDNDESYYFSAIKFFMEFNRNYKFQVKLVSETMSVETFHFVQKYLENWFEMMATDKKRIPLWSSRMHIALNAYKELLQNLAAMDSNADAGVRESSKVIKSNIFYVIEYRELLLTLTNTYEKTKYSRQYLKDLIETLHIFLKLLSALTKHRKLVVQKQVKRKKSKTKNKKSKSRLPGDINIEDSWRDLSERLSTLLVSPVEVDVIPFDAASDMTMDEQKEEAVKKINTFLKTNKLEEAVAMLRASREVWPENDTFGSSTISPEEELSWFKEVFLADLQIDPDILVNAEEDNEEDAEEDEEENVNYREYAEQNFDIMDLIKRFASPKVIAICTSLLQTFDTNTDFTNHCVVKMLHRIAWDCKLPAMLFQASLFCIFQKILSSDNPKYKELAKLAIYIVRKFTEVAATNKKVFIELLFYKTAKEAYEIECGYGSFIEHRLKSKLQASKVFWEEHEEEELKRLHEEYLKNEPSQDMVEWIMDNLINKERSKRIVMKKMKELNLIITKPKVKKYTEEQENELCSLFEQFREAHDPVKSVMEKLSFPMSRSQIKNALLRLKVVSDKSELKKKKKSNKRRNKSILQEEDENEEGSNSSSGSEVDEIENSRKEEPPVPLPEAIIHLVEATPSHSYLTEGLKWIKASLQECLEDLEDDPSEVPLLPLSADSILSIDFKKFQQFLEALKICKPQQQEVYWRIPASWKDTDLLNRINLIEVLLAHDEDELSSYSDELNLPIKKISGESCDLSKILMETRLLNDSRISGGYDSDNNEEDETFPKNAADNNLKYDKFHDIIANHCRKALDNELISDTSKMENKTSNKSKKKKFSRFESSDSDSDVQENVGSLISKVSSSTDKENEHLQSSELFEMNKFEKSLDSADDLSPLSKNKKKSLRRVIVHDSSDDEDKMRTDSTILGIDSDKTYDSVDQRSFIKLVSDSNEDLKEQEIHQVSDSVQNYMQFNNDLKRLRSDSEEEENKNVPTKSNRKKRFILDSDDE
ncbi:circadian regulator timeout isoform X3 [Rhodnius prolixus]|uniref:circadian regulator timeout isoform X3 n=1 Tax=Rhodnius prolixus TaxID=13249 RepID=UPI003D18EA43